MKKLIPYFLIIIFFISSFSILFVITNYINLNREINDYIENCPISYHIIVGHNGFLENIKPKYQRLENKIDALLYAYTGEIFEEIEESSFEIEEPKLEDSEIKKILEFQGIKSGYFYDYANLGNMYVRIPLKEKIQIVSYLPLPLDYLKALHPLLEEGRYYDENDPSNVIIITYDFSKLIFQNESPIGKDITLTIGKENRDFKIIGVLSEINKNYSFLFSRYSVFIPYIPTTQQYYYRGDNEKVPYISMKEILIIPEEGKANALLKEIKKILGKEKYDAIVYYSAQNLEYDTRYQVRKERIATLSLVSIFIIIVNIFSIMSFINFDILSKRREIGIKRAIGATIIKISNDYFIYIAKLFFIGYLFSLFFFHLFVPFFMKYNRLGYYIGGYSGSITEIIPINLDFTSIIISFLLIIALIYFFSLFFVNLTLKQTPATLIKSFEQKREISFIPFLAIITTLCVITLFTSSSIIVSQRKLINDIFNDIEPQVMRILPKAPYGIGEDVDFSIMDYVASYTYEDYKTIKEAFKEKATIGFRLNPPYLTKIPNPQDINKRFELRIAGATEDFPSIFNLTISEGRFLRDGESGVCVIGFNVYKTFNLQIGGNLMGFEVVGILENKAKLTDNSLFISLIDFPILFPTPLSGSEGGQGFIFVKTIDRNDNQIYEEILDLLEKMHPGKLRGKVLDFGELIQQIAEARISTYILVLILSIFFFTSSLLYFSIFILMDGIKRIKEIGIKRAIGATEKNIKMEFILKGVKIGIISLVIGIIFGILISMFIAAKEGIELYIPFSFIAFFIISYIILIILFSLIPAQYASKIKPYEAIRSE